MANPVSWRPSAEMTEWLLGRAERSASLGSVSSRTRIEMELWRAGLAAELAQQSWTLAEIGMIADICNGAIVPDTIGSNVAANVADAVAAHPGSYGSKWGIDEHALLGRLLLLGPVADIALTDAVARWWAAGLPHTVEGWVEVGLWVRDGG